MRQVWKFEAPFPGQNVVHHMPGEPVPLALSPHPNGKVECWFSVEPRGSMREVALYTFETWHQYPEEDLVHVGTYRDGPYVWHVFAKWSSV